MRIDTCGIICSHFSTRTSSRLHIDINSRLVTDAAPASCVALDGIKKRSENPATATSM